MPKCDHCRGNLLYKNNLFFLFHCLLQTNGPPDFQSNIHEKKGNQQTMPWLHRHLVGKYAKVIIKSTPDWGIPMFFLNKRFLMSPNSARHRFFQVYTGLQPWLVPQRVGLPSLRGTVTCSRPSESMKTWFVRGLCKACWIEMNAPGRKAPFSIRH